METTYWHKKWETQNILFHSSDINAQLIALSSHLGKLDNKNVFIPLCGKSLDILWFMQQHANVIGVELSPIAVKAFFTENRVPYIKTERKNFTTYSFAEGKILLGDFFNLTRQQISNIDLVYDRAALVALPEPLRWDYIRKISSFLQPGAMIFLITHEFESPFPEKPPFSLTHENIQYLYASNYHINLIHESKNTESCDKLRKRDFRNITQRVYLMRKLYI